MQEMHVWFVVDVHESVRHSRGTLKSFRPASKLMVKVWGLGFWLRLGVKGEGWTYPSRDCRSELLPQLFLEKLHTSHAHINLCPHNP